MKPNFLPGSSKPICVALSTGAGLESGTAWAVRLLTEAGFETKVFDLSYGSADFEAELQSGQFQAVLDFYTADLMDSQKGTNRLTAAGIRALPQIISVGGLDFHPERQTPSTPEEMDRMGKDIVEKACAARGPTRIVLPLKGISQRVRNDASVDSLFQSIRNWVYPPELLMESDQSVNDREFVELAVNTIIAMTGEPEKFM